MQDGLKWFGEGFEGFPRILPEDTVEYCIYIFEATLKDGECRQRLREVKAAAGKWLKEKLAGFIWLRESFDLEIKHDGKRMYLHGRVNYGDSIDDEWLIVFLLRELSRQFDDLWIRVVDADGQFLLIEAADALPAWLTPEIADFRVWMHNSDLLIIPPAKPGGSIRGIDQSDENITLDQAILWINDPRKRLQHSQKIQKSAFDRLDRYPQKILDSMHHAVLSVPRKIAYLLHECPAYISPAIEAFYLRDPIALKPIRTNDSGTLTFPPEDIVSTSIAFPRIGFAQLRGQQFELPSLYRQQTKLDETVKVSQQWELGMRVTCGFEMMLRDPQNQDKRAVREVGVLLGDLKDGAANLPSAEHVYNWGQRNDDEKWLDINYEEFDRELAGKDTTRSANETAGFGDKSTQANLQKIVERFQKNLDDNENGTADLFDDTDESDEEDDISDQSDDEQSDPEDYHPRKNDESFLSNNEDDFTAMMRQMMEMPKNVLDEMMTATTKSRHEAIPATSPLGSSQDSPSSDNEDDAEEIRKTMQQIKVELSEAGALKPESHDPNASTAGHLK